MKRVTLSQLNGLGACKDGIDSFVETFGKLADTNKVFASLIKGEKLDWANWLIVRLLNRKDGIRYAIYAAEQVIEIFEKKYPKDDRPRKAIEAAKAVLKKNNVKTRAAAYDASAAANAASNAANAASNAAYAAAYAAYAAYAAPLAAAYNLSILSIHRSAHIINDGS